MNFVYYGYKPLIMLLRFTIICLELERKFKQFLIIYEDRLKIFRHITGIKRKSFLMHFKFVHYFKNNGSDLNYWVGW